MASLKIVEDIDEVVSDDVFTTSQELLHVFFLVVGSDGEEHFDLAESLQTCPLSESMEPPPWKLLGAATFCHKPRL